jgi:hypothetical protein
MNIFNRYLSSIKGLNPNTAHINTHLHQPTKNLVVDENLGLNKKACHAIRGRQKFNCNDIIWK